MASLGCWSRAFKPRLPWLQCLRVHYFLKSFTSVCVQIIVALEREVIVRQEEEYGGEFMIIKFSSLLRWIFLDNKTSHLSDMAVLNQGTKDLHFFPTACFGEFRNIETWGVGGCCFANRVDNKVSQLWY